MENTILLALAVTGTGLVILLLILTLLAFMVNVMTSLIKGKDEEKDESAADEKPGKTQAIVEQGVAEKAAALGVAFALAELQISPVSGGSKDNHFAPWREFHRARRLNQTIRTRRN
jgi:Na+-transporting methylmalonyl-CoA/oxaloacetate decarboxylase gamma subunit